MKIWIKRKTISGFLLIFTAIVNLNNFCFAATLKNTSQIKPFAAAIFIDYDSEVDLHQNKAITFDLSALFYLQACPLIIFGQHLLTNLIQKPDFLKFGSNTDLKYFIAVKNALHDFDKNWLIFEISKKKAIYVLLPKKYLEYYFDLDLCNIKTSLLQELDNICTQGKVISSDGFICKTIREIFWACGFGFYNGAKYNLLSYSDLLNKKIETKTQDQDDFYLSIQHCLTNLLRVANENNKWYLSLNGHGSIASKPGSVNVICGLSEEDFRIIFENICKKNVAWIHLSACYLGGPNRKIVEEVAKKMFDKNKCPCIAIQSATDSPSCAFSPQEIYSEDLLEQVKKLNLMIFEPKNSATTLGIYSSSILPPSFFKGQNIMEAFLTSTIWYTSTFDGNVVHISNWPLILNPSKNLKFIPMEYENYIFLVSTENRGSKSTLETNGQQIVFLDTMIIKNIKFSEKIPFLLSVPAEPSIHMFKKIDVSNFDIDINTFFKKTFINQQVQIACSKEFLIKELILGKENKKYLNVYINQFGKEEEDICFIDIIWQDTYANKTYYNQYKFNKNDEYLKNEKISGWTETSEVELSSQEISTYMGKINETEQYITSRFRC